MPVQSSPVPSIWGASVAGWPVGGDVLQELCLPGAEGRLELHLQPARREAGGQAGGRGLNAQG